MRKNRKKARTINAKTATCVDGATVTAAVTGPTTAEKAAYELLLRSKHFVVGNAGDEQIAAESAFRFGRLAGKFEGFQAGTRAPRTPGEERAKQQLPTVGLLLSEVFKEVRSAVTKHGPMHSPHEAYAVIKEEVDEYWDEVKADRAKQGSGRTELVQIAAMAIRALLDTNPR